MHEIPYIYIIYIYIYNIYIYVHTHMIIFIECMHVSSCIIGGVRGRLLTCQNKTIDL